MRKWIIGGGLVLAAAAAAALIFPGLTDNQLSSVAAQDIETAVVERRTLNETIESAGTVTAERTISLSFGTSGTVETVAVDVGDTVTAGDVLARLSISDLEYQIRLQEQALVVQQANYDQLIAPPTASEEAQARAALASAQSQLVQAQQNLASAPNSVTINCADVTTRQRAVDDAQAAYDDYVTAGYEMDATFRPDADSTEGEALRDALDNLSVAQAQCDNTTTVEEYEIQLASAQASFDEAQASLDALLAGADAEDIASAEAQLAQQQLELDNARAALADAELVAPFDGVIASVDILEGGMVTSTAAVITLVDTSTLYVDLQVDELDIPLLSVEQPVIVSPDALEDTTLDGQIARIAPVSETTDGVVTYDVRVALEAWQDLPIYVGMTANVEIILGSQPDALVVPTEAIQRAGTNEFVSVLVDGAEQQVSVTTGVTIDGFTVITGEIEVGAQVVIPAEESQQPGGFGGPFGG
ncbi:MAG: efflux RND transporter periplasmic adaptor subunit [bacterium]|nr:efflux RND transporter periplasmic adaptor subunit [bacterium]